MKHTNFLARPMEVKAFLDASLDEENDQNKTDWREKARQLRLRRWRKISQQGQAVSEAIFSHKPHRRVGGKLLIG